MKYLTFILLSFSITNAHANSETQAAICGENGALISVYNCDIGPIGSGGSCVLLGLDKNKSGTWNLGDEFIIIDGENKQNKVTYDKVKSLPNVDKNGYSSCLSLFSNYK